VNIHGYFAGGGMYWRESARLAEQLGWRVVNPSLPGFGGSDPLEWQDVSMENLANEVMAVVHKVGAGPVVLLGHSMGGAVAVQFAHDHPRRTLGVIYRDGVSTPAWKDRTGVIPTVLSPLLPDVAPMVDMIAAVIFDLPDLFIGRMYSTVRAVLPDVRQNIRTVAQTMPVGSMLMSLDQRSQVRGLVAQQIPILNEWGCFDRITPSHTALEFAAIARAPVQWVPGGHSWMLARPQGQADILTYLQSGKEFMDRMEDRWRQLTPREVTLRAVN
jgi:pimeloyl-ACP methyl ester carboxylesterase